MSENYDTLHPYPLEVCKDKWRRACGCIKTSEKLKQILMTFPHAPPPTPLFGHTFAHQPPVIHCISSCCTKSGHVNHHGDQHPCLDQPPEDLGQAIEEANPDKIPKTGSRPKQLLIALVSLIQLSVMATALALYYLIYCYMQLVYFTLKSALYFHNADGPMKVTIGVMTLTTLVVGFNILLKMERLMYIDKVQ